jgi:hypothetical protein
VVGVSGDRESPEQRRALFRVVRGEPTDAEVAALVVVLAAVGSAGAATADRPRPLTRWSDPVARLRTPLHPGPGAWRASAWPR